MVGGDSCGWDRTAHLGHKAAAGVGREPLDFVAEIPLTHDTDCAGRSIEFARHIALAEVRENGFGRSGANFCVCLFVCLFLQC